MSEAVMKTSTAHVLRVLGQMDWEDGMYPRILYAWEYNGTLIIAPFRRGTFPDAEVDGVRQILRITPTQMYPDYGNLSRKRAWFREMCAYMQIQFIEE